MLKLRLIQQALSSSDEYHVRLELTGDENYAPHVAEARFSFALTPQDGEDIRWYLEDYLQFPFDPAPKVAARVEARLSEIGGELFRAIFQADDDMMRVICGPICVTV